jgi:hypothetical protein
MVEPALKAGGESRERLAARIEAVEAALARLVAKVMAVKGAPKQTRSLRTVAAIQEAARASELFKDENEREEQT